MLKDALVGAEVLGCSAESLNYRTGGKLGELANREGALVRSLDGASEILSELGPGGSVRFRLDGPQLTFEVHASHSGSAHTLTGRLQLAG